MDSTTPNDSTTYIKAMLFPHYDVNGKYYRIGDFQFQLNNKLPFNSIDEVDQFLNTFYKYIDEASQKNFDDESIKEIHEKFKKTYYTKDIPIFTNIKYRKKTVREKIAELQELQADLTKKPTEKEKINKEIEELKKRLPPELTDDEIKEAIKKNEEELENLKLKQKQNKTSKGGKKSKRRKFKKSRRNRTRNN
jgi:lipoate-protein ligase A